MQPKTDRVIRILPHPARLRVCWRGHVIADTTGALILHEGSYPAVHYIPRADIDMTMLKKTATVTRSPFKGEAVYFSLHSEDATALDVAWSYEKPFPNVGQISGHLAFDVKAVEFIENNTP
jgi:uncharacterized protein (DUF427 family)